MPPEGTNTPAMTLPIAAALRPGAPTAANRAIASMSERLSAFSRPARLAATTTLALAVAAGYGLLLEAEAGHAHAAPMMAAIFAAAALSSVAGFAFSALCGALLFHLPLDPILVVQTMMACSIAIQLLSLAALRNAIGWAHLPPFLAGGLLGLPLGLALLLMIPRGTFTLLLGLLLCAYAALMLVRRPVAVFRPSRVLDALVGLCGGITGGIMAFPGAPVTIWCQMKGWPRDRQRGVFQPYILAMQVAAIALLAATGASGPSGPLPPLGWLALPPALLGAIIGLRVYRGMSDRRFALTINVMLLVSGGLLVLTR